MSFAPPSGPPPPSVPEGWKAQYDDRYHAWFYVDLATGKSQWDRPEAPPTACNAGPGDPAAIASAGDQKQHMGSNNPYNPSTNTGPGNASPHMIDEDARLAAKLQAEEDARAGIRGPGAGLGDRGASSDYYNDASRPQSTGPGGYAAGPASHSPMPEQEQKRSKGGFLSKLMGKSSSSRPARPQQQYASYVQQGPPPGAYYGGGGYPPQQGPQPGYGGGYGGYPQQGGYYQQQPPRRQGGGGMGTAGAAALGVGGGLLGGMLIADAIDDHHDNDDYGGGGGGGDDYGGDDFGGGDF
ncbi:WW/Rsp5/WWP [Penicillium expansum]|nr:WW/Rsp5/WWP [Penicillium expansum]